MSDRVTTTSRVTRVVLHKHGMGCFERLARVTDDARLDLSFRHDEMDDALKSISVVDHGGGQLAAIAYEPHPKLSERLDDIKVRLPEGGGMLALLGQMIGAEADLDLGGQRVVGRIVGIEKVPEARGEVAVEIDYLSLLVGDNLRRLRVSDIAHLTPADATLRRDLSILLQRMDAQRRTERRRVTLDLRGHGERQLSVVYTVPATVWKTSYRVVFGGGEKSEPERPLLLGFALVDNDSQDDWDDVSLSLVSGLPISFTHDLYSPRRRARPHVRVETEAPIAPPVLEGATFDLPAQEPPLADVDLEYDEETDIHDRSTGSMVAASRPAPAMYAPPPGAAPAPARAVMDAAAAGSIRVATRTQELGDMFRYDVTTPVSIRAGHSALVPILDAPLEGEVVAVYNERVRVGNPLTSFRLKNSSTLTLEGGPATVFRDGEYAGEAMLDTMRPGDEKLVPFSVELGCRLTTAFDSATEAGQGVTLSGGAFYHTTWTRRLTTYTVKNTTRRRLKLFLDHPADRSAEYVDTPKPAERTETFDRFVLESEPGKQLEFKVTERRETVQSMWITPEQIDAQLKIAEVAEARKGVLQALEPLVTLARRIGELDHDRRKIESQIAEIDQKHERIRRNLEALRDENKKERELRERYVTVLDQDETRLEQLRADRTEMERRAQEARKKFDELAKAISI